MVGTEADFAARIQGERAAAGLSGYITPQELVAVARDHAEAMADQNRLHHNPLLPNQVENWESLGENVGKGASVDDMASEAGSQAGSDPVKNPAASEGPVSKQPTKPADNSGGPKSNHRCLIRRVRRCPLSLRRRARYRFRSRLPLHC